VLASKATRMQGRTLSTAISPAETRICPICGRSISSPKKMLESLRADGFEIAAGQLGENLSTRGLSLESLPCGSQLAIGTSAVIELTGLRTPCILIDRFKHGLKQKFIVDDQAVPYRAGVLGIVRQSGLVTADDPVAVSCRSGRGRRCRLSKENDTQSVRLAMQRTALPRRSLAPEANERSPEALAEGGPPAANASFHFPGAFLTGLGAALAFGSRPAGVATTAPQRGLSPSGDAHANATAPRFWNADPSPVLLLYGKDSRTRAARIGARLYCYGGLCRFRLLHRRLERGVLDHGACKSETARGRWQESSIKGSTQTHRPDERAEPAHCPRAAQISPRLSGRLP